MARLEQITLIIYWNDKTKLHLRCPNKDAILPLQNMSTVLVLFFH